MIKYVIAAVCAVVLIILIRNLSVKSKVKKLTKNKVDLPEDFTVTAHAGSMGTKDNSYESLIVGAKNADIIEIDVKFDKNSNPVLAHTKVQGDCVQLYTAFAIAAERKNLQINIDMKDKDERLIRVQSLADTYAVTDRVFFTGIEENAVVCVRENCPRIKYYLNIDVNKKKRKNKEYLLSLVEKVKENGAVGINLDKSAFSKELVTVFRENGLLVSVWTAKTKSDIVKLLKLAPDNITTRKPDVINTIIKE